MNLGLIVMSKKTSKIFKNTHTSIAILLSDDIQDDPYISLPLFREENTSNNDITSTNI